MRSVKWWQGWAPVIALPPAVLILAPVSWPPWVVMWTLAIAIYSGCKWLTWRGRVRRQRAVDGVVAESGVRRPDFIVCRAHRHLHMGRAAFDGGLKVWRQTDEKVEERVVDGRRLELPTSALRT